MDFKFKHGESGAAGLFKCHLVVIGCSKSYGIQYVETFSPVARFQWEFEWVEKSD